MSTAYAINKSRSTVQDVSTEPCFEDDGFNFAGASSSLLVHATRPKEREREREREREMVYNGLQCESISQFGIYIPRSKKAA
jgi:hypothetical protein